MINTVSDNVVEEYKIGNTTIKICDAAYKDKTKEELEETYRRINAVCMKIIKIEAVKRNYV